MTWFRFPLGMLALGALALMLVAGDGLLGQEKKDGKEPPLKFKGTLPQNWGKLGLTDKQKQSIYKAQSEYGEKIDALKKQIKSLTDQRDAEMLKVLTDEQQKRLKEILAGKAGGDKDAKKDSKDK